MFGKSFMELKRGKWFFYFLLQVRSIRMRGIKTYLRENETSWEEISDEMKLDSSCIKTKCEKLSSRCEKL